MPYRDDQPKLSDASDVTLEVDAFGNQYLHLILPAEKLNFLNGLNGSNSFFGTQTNGTGGDSFYYQS